MVMQFSVSGREEERAFNRPEAVAAADLSEGKSQGCWVSKERRVGGGPWVDGTVSRVLVNCASHLGGSLLCSVLGIGGDGEFGICDVIHRCPTRGSASLSDEELDGLCNAEY